MIRNERILAQRLILLTKIFHWRAKREQPSIFLRLSTESQDQNPILTVLNVRRTLWPRKGPPLVRAVLFSWSSLSLSVSISLSLSRFLTHIKHEAHNRYGLDYARGLPFILNTNLKTNDLTGAHLGGYL